MLNVGRSPDFNITLFFQAGLVLGMAIYEAIANKFEFNSG